MFNHRIGKFARLVNATHGLPESVLVTIVKASDLHSPSYRAAALRHLVACSPISVTLGLPFAQRRRLVRRHYGV